MPKLVIPKQSLPPVNAEQDAYFIRFRIITDDKNLSSYWSNIFRIDAGTSFVVQPAIVNHNSGIITAAWEQVEEVNNYDVWYSWSNGTGTWLYYGRISQTSFVSAAPSGVNKFSIKVFAETQENNQNPTFLLYQTLNVGI